MYYLPLRFISVGSDITVCATRIVAIFDAKTVQGKRMAKAAKDSGIYLDARGGRALRSLILMDNDAVIACSLMPITLYKRLQDGQQLYVKNMVRVKDNIKRQFVDKAAEDGITVVETDEYEEVDSAVEDPENKAYPL